MNEELKSGDESVIRALLNLGKLPDTVHHYTGPKGFLGLLGTRKMWATEVRYLNDSEEFTYASSMIRGRLEELLKNPDQSDDSICLRECVRALDLAPRLQLYVASFCANSDQLSQWRAYCPKEGGYSIGFSSAKLMKSTGSVLLPCVYDVGTQVVLCETLLEAVLSLYRKDISRVDSNGQRLHLAADFMSGFVYLAAALKHEGFREESEWRLMTRRSAEGVHVPKYREGRGGIVPYVELAFSDKGKCTALSTIVMGPNVHSQIGRGAVDRFLKANAIECGDVRLSSIPYRSW
jgi:hypothetical protein